LCIPSLYSVAASTFRKTDYRGGANGARIRLAPQKDWKANNPAVLAEVLKKYEAVQQKFPEVSMADIIVLGGCQGVEAAAANAGVTVEVPFKAGRADASADQTDAASFAVLEPEWDAFRNYNANPYQLVDKAHMLNLTAPEMTALIGGLRVLNVNVTDDKLGVLTDKADTLSQDFFVNLTDMKYKWEKTADPLVFEGKDRSSGSLKYKASLVDLTFGSNFELRAIVEHYACDDAKEEFVKDFAQAFAKVMDSDRYV